MGGAPASATWMGSRSTVTLSETWLGSVLDMLEGFLKKANKSEFNSLHTGSFWFVSGAKGRSSNEQNVRPRVVIKMPLDGANITLFWA